VRTARSRRIYREGRYAGSMPKHVRKGATVDATEVTKTNFDSLAESVGAKVYAEPDTGTRYMIVESPNGSSRAEIGGYVVALAGNDGYVGYRDSKSFAEAYERP
jgi:hypothetical protein